MGSHLRSGGQLTPGAGVCRWFFRGSLSWTGSPYRKLSPHEHFTAGHSMRTPETLWIDSEPESGF